MYVVFIESVAKQSNSAAYTQRVFLLLPGSVWYDQKLMVADVSYW